MADREIIIQTLKFLKDKKDDKKNYVNPKDSPDFASLPESIQESIRDKCVIYRYASMPNIGREWELSITWHPDGGVDVLNKSQINKNVLSKDGSINSTYKNWNLLKKHATTIIVSVIGGLILLWISSYLFKSKTEIPKQQFIWDYGDKADDSTDTLILIQPDSVGNDSNNEP